MSRIHRIRAYLPQFASIAILAFAGNAAQAQSITEYAVPTSASGPAKIVAGSDGNLWFTENTAGKIGRITPAGVVTEFSIPTSASGALGITAGPDGNIWFVENSSGKIGMITASGTVTEYTIPTSGSAPYDIKLGSDGNLWFTENGASRVGSINPYTGAISEYHTPSSSSQPRSIHVGGDGNMWFTETGVNKFGKVTLGAGTPSITEYPNTADASASLRAITEGPDGALYFIEASVDKLGKLNLDGTVAGTAAPPTASPGLGAGGQGPDGVVWFVEDNANNIARISFANISGNPTINEYRIPTASSSPEGLTAGPDGNLWFTEGSGNKIGKLIPPASTSTVFGAVLPASRSVEVGGNVATAFATLINSSSSSLSNCQILPFTEVPASFNYQTTNAITNALTGTQNTSVNIAAGGSQSFVIAFIPNQALISTNVQLFFYCQGSDPALPIIGVNTLLLSQSPTPVPDVITLGATPTGDGILDIKGASGSNAFAVATANVGATGAITASVDTGSATVPVNLTICQSNSTTGACLNPAVASYGPITINANATPTFSIFATATGSIAFNPGGTRIFVRFKDSGGVVRGSTSVAVRTQ